MASSPLTYFGSCQKLIIMRNSISVLLFVYAIISYFQAAPISVAAEPDIQPPANKKLLKSNPDIELLLEPVRQKYQVPGIVAGIVENDRLIVAGAVGLRKHGSPVAITVNDDLHLGSNTKAMTATLLALLVEENKLSWESTVGDVFSKLKPKLHADFRDVTLSQLLAHRAGLPADGPWWKLGTGSQVKQRERLLIEILGKPPIHPPGTKHLYSNVGYAIAGHMAEQVTGKSWEDLMTTKLFKPLKMSSGGFGIPGHLTKIDQPWGHHLVSGSVEAIQHDNAPALGPAGTVHCSLLDWSKFIALHLQGARGARQFLTSESFKTLHTPPNGQSYAYGWIIAPRPWANGAALTHSGSNTLWYATVWMAPARNVAFLVVTNQGGDAAAEACDKTTVSLIEYYGKNTMPQVH